MAQDDLREQYCNLCDTFYKENVEHICDDEYEFHLRDEEIEGVIHVETAGGMKDFPDVVTALEYMVNESASLVSSMKACERAREAQENQFQRRVEEIQNLMKIQSDLLSEVHGSKEEVEGLKVENERLILERDALREENQILGRAIIEAGDILFGTPMFHRSAGYGMTDE